MRKKANKTVQDVTRNFESELRELATKMANEIVAKVRETTLARMREILK